MAEFCKSCGKKLSQKLIQQGENFCDFKCKKASFQRGSSQDVSAKGKCPLSRLIVEVKTSKDEPVGQAEVTVLKGGVQVKQDMTDEHGKYDTGKVLQEGRYTVKAKRKCYKPKEAEKTPPYLRRNDEEKVDLTLDPYEIKITAKQPSYTIVLDENRNPKKPDHPILEFDITDGPPDHFFDVQLSRDSADGLTGGPGLPEAWKPYAKDDERLRKTVYSSYSNGELPKLDGSGKAKYTMPLKWWQDLYDTPLNQFDKSDFYYRVLAMDESNLPPCTTSETDKVEVKKEYKTVKIWLLTWNCELMAPSEQQLHDLFVDYYNHHEAMTSELEDLPELIVIGLQEASKSNGKFVAERLADKQDPQKSKLKNYRFLDHLDYSGRTKGKCYQDLGVLVRSDVYDKAKNISKNKKSTKWIGCKGGLILTIKFDGDVNLAFISAHLDAGTKQESNIQKIIRQIKELAKKGKFDAVFMMGDLNYRLAPKSGGILMKQTTNQDLANMILTQQDQLLQQDLLASKCSLVKQGNNPHFVFPKPDLPFFPTYKINYEEGGYYTKSPEQRGRLTKTPSYKFFNNDQSVNLALQTYCWEEVKVKVGKKKVRLPKYQKSDDPVAYNEKRKAFDVGWLDRIGWADQADFLSRPS